MHGPLGIVVFSGKKGGTAQAHAHRGANPETLPGELSPTIAAQCAKRGLNLERVPTEPEPSFCSRAQRKEAIQLKEEYHAFRDRAGVVLFAAAAVLLAGLLRADAVRQAGEPFSLTPPFMVGCQAFLAWLLYFYTALALRENVLKVGAPCAKLSGVPLITCRCMLEGAPQQKAAECPYENDP